MHKLKRQGKVRFVGVGAKNWKIIEQITKDVELDWIMVANSMTIKSHSQELMVFILEAERKGIYVINSAVFHSGFLVGSNYFDYRLIEKSTEQNDELFNWRKSFFNTCYEFINKSIKWGLLIIFAGAQQRRSLSKCVLARNNPASSRRLS